MADEYGEYEKPEMVSNPLWKPATKGETVEGIFKGARKTVYGDVYDIETKDGTVTAPSRSVIVTKMTALEPKEGDKLRLTFLGEVKSQKTGRIYTDFDVEIARKK